MNFIARELLKIAAELSPKLVITVHKPEESVDDYITAMISRIEDTVVTVRRNEGLESQVRRYDTDGECVIEISFTDHKSMREICDYIIDNASDIAEKFALNVEFQIK